MNSFDNYIGLNREGSLLHINDECPLYYKKSLEINTARTNNSNNLSTSSIIHNKSSILLPNKSQREPLDISKKNLEYDIQITALKKKLAMIKEQRKNSENKIHLMKLRINQLQNEEKASIKDLENIKKSIQNIKNNRKKNEYKKNYVKKVINTNNNINKSYNSYNRNINNSNIKERVKNKNSNLLGHQSFHISMKKNNNFSIFTNNNYTPKSKIFINKKALNTSNNKTNTSSNDNFGTYSFRNISINLDKININGSKNSLIMNKGNRNSNTNININNKNEKDLKSQIKQNLVNKLREDEKERKRIQEEIRRLEKQQYNLWMNFNENMNENNNIGNTSDNKTSIKRKIKKTLKKNFTYDCYYKDKDEEDDNLVNYN